MAKTNNAAVNVVTSQALAAAGTVRGTIDVRSADGGRLTLKITNGGTGPTAQCEARILVAHTSGSTPVAASANSDWKSVYKIGGGTAANTVTETTWVFGPDVRHIEVEFTGNTGQAVIVEAIASTYTYT